ncbi:hypothetical protein, partial [Providencia stuartii]|uniref:hypothetical protein n=1 Tax=Providencia stuartii TaxID=588 RepID=UPI0019546866
KLLLPSHLLELAEHLAAVGHEPAEEFGGTPPGEPVFHVLGHNVVPPSAHVAFGAGLGAAVAGELGFSHGSRLMRCYSWIR